MIYKLICVKCDELYESKILNPDPNDDICIKCRNDKIKLHKEFIR